MTDYGPFAPIVSYAGAGLAAVSAIVLAWKRRARWEPAEEDVPSGGQKVSAVMALVAMVYILLNINRDNLGMFIAAAGALSTLLLISLLTYVFLISTCTYDGKKSRKIIGGIWPTDFAKREMKKQDGETLQGLLRRFDFEKDRVWPRSAQACSKVLFISAYVGMIFSGTVAVTIAGAAVATKSTESSLKNSAIGIPGDSTAVAGFAKLHWVFEHEASLSNLRYSIQIESNGHPNSLIETRQNVSVRLDPGKFRWRVRPIWDKQPQDTPWSNWQKLVVYANTLERIKSTHRIRIGQTQGYQRSNRLAADGRPENFWTVWLPKVFQHEFDIDVTPEIVVSRWMDDSGRNTYLRLLDEDLSVDVLASGLTVTLDRERDFGIRFAKPVGSYKPLIVSRQPIAEIQTPIRLGAIAQTTNEYSARELVRAAPTKWKYEEPDASITGADVYADLLKALESDRVDAIVIDQPYMAALRKDSNINLQIDYLQHAVEALKLNESPFFQKEDIGIATRIEDVALRDVIARYTGSAWTKNLWENYFPGPSDK